MQGKTSPRMVKLPVNTKPKARCTVEDCPNPRHGRRLLCKDHIEEQEALLNPKPEKGDGFTVAEAFTIWSRNLNTPQLWLGKYKVYGIKPVGSMYALVVGKHDEPVIVPSDKELTLIKVV